MCLRHIGFQMPPFMKHPKWRIYHTTASVLESHQTKKCCWRQNSVQYFCWITMRIETHGMYLAGREKEWNPARTVTQLALLTCGIRFGHSPLTRWQVQWWVYPLSVLGRVQLGPSMTSVTWSDHPRSYLTAHQNGPAQKVLHCPKKCCAYKKVLCASKSVVP
jgi:hypothetical protein